jgi:hypothetical protein
MGAFCGMRSGLRGVMENRDLDHKSRRNLGDRPSHISPESNRTMHAMNPRMHRPLNKTFQALAASALAWAGPAHCAPPAFAWSWSEVWSDPGMDTLLFVLTGLFWLVTHMWTLVVVWAEARATRSAVAGTAAKKAQP